MIRVYLNKEKYEKDTKQKWGEKLNYSKLGKIESAKEDGSDVEIDFVTFLRMFEDKAIENDDVVFYNKFGHTNFSTPTEDGDEVISSYGFNQANAKFEFYDSKKLKNEVLEIPAADSIISLMETLVFWEFQNEIVTPNLSNDVKNYLATWAKFFGVKVTTINTFASLDDFDGDIESFAKIKYKAKKVDWRSYEIYKEPGVTRELTNVRQDQIIKSIVANALKAQKGNKYHDHFITAPTGTGKSIMFQSAAHFLAEKEGLLTIVISPLISLMKDQVQAFQKDYPKVASINSEITFMDRTKIVDDINKGDINIVYVSPETLLANSYTNLFSNRRLGLLVVDEAHIATTWGKGFRPDYWYLDKWVKKVQNDPAQGKFGIATFTATATYSYDDDSAMNRETRINLSMIDPIEIIAPAYRKDIQYDIEASEQVMNKQDYEAKKAEDIIKMLKEISGKTIIYFPYRSQIATIGNELSKAGFEYSIYHGGMDRNDKADNSADFVNGKTKILLATKAYGMGIDIEDIEHVIHYAPTGSLNDYLQEVGRAARRTDLIGHAHINAILPGKGQKGSSDFTFIDQLHGMSAIRDTEIKHVAQQILNVYNKTKQRNLLMSIDNFLSFDDGDEDSAEKRAKTIFVMLQKDIIRKFGFPGVVIRPSMILTEVLAKRGVINNVNRFDKFATKTSYPDIYTLNLEKVWETFFKDWTFPEFKFRYFAPIAKLRALNVSEKDIERMRELKFSYNPRQIIEFNCANEYDLEAKVIASAEKADLIFSRLLKESGSSEIDEKVISKVAQILKVSRNSIKDLIDAYIAWQQFMRNKNFDKMPFIQSNVVKNAARNSYQITGSGLFKKIALSLKEWIYDREKMSGNTMITPIDLDKNSKYLETMMAFKILELSNLYEMEFKSGSTPKVFIRINLSASLERVLDTRYENSFVTAAFNRYNFDKEVMHRFFAEKMTDIDRRKYIEDYFLLKLEEKFKKEREENEEKEA